MTHVFAHPPKPALRLHAGGVAGGDRDHRGPDRRAAARAGVAADASCVFHLVWLDSRERASKALRYAQSSDDGATWSRNVTLDADTCQCCWNTIAVSPGGKVAALYRDRSPRDMAVIRSDDGGRSWSNPVTVGPFGWDIDACPHVGGGLAFLSGGGLAAVVWTGDAKAHGAYVLRSPDGGKTWRPPQRLGTPHATRPTVAAGGGGDLLPAWDAFTDGAQAIFPAISRDGGKSWSPPVRLSKPGVSATHARAFATPAGPRVLWTEAAPGKATRWVVTAPEAR